MSLLKNTSRFEWFLEKATEIGVSEIVPLLCDRTEKQHFRQDRMQQILVSALLQSQQAWLPLLHVPTPAAQLIRGATWTHRYIAHCLEAAGEKISLSAMAGPKVSLSSREESSNDMPSQEAPAAAKELILIGPEGDFSPHEIGLALEHGFQPVTLGETRLRTETAGIVAATLLCIR